MTNIVYQSNAQDHTARQTAEGFARSWFDHERTIETFETIVPDGIYRFTLLDGCAVYQIRHIPGIHLVSFPLWQITRLEVQ